jgi:hypothetical protein
VTQNPQSQIVFLGDAVTFTGAADGAQSYRWRRNGVDIPGATSPTLTLASTSPADNQASFTLVASNSFGDATSAPAVLTVTSNHFPVPTMVTPAEGSGFATGDKIAFSATATDAEDGNLPPSAFTWQIDFRHDTHAHPAMAATSGIASGTYTVPEFESDIANTWFRISLTAKDSAGLTKTVTRDIFPRNQLSDMTPVGTPVNGLGPIENDKRNGDAAAGDGGPITLDGIPYQKGLGVFAPSDVRYQLGGQCTGHLIADVGVDDAVGDQGSVIFQVFLDGEKAFDSGIMRGSDKRKAVFLSVAGKQELRLVVTDAGDGNSLDQADWAGARVTGCPVLAGQPTVGADTGATPTTPPVGGSGSGGGGGCAIGGDNRFDPVLPGMLIAAIAFLLLRRRAKHAQRID